MNTTATATETNENICQCGCGLAATEGYTFRPGHDAKFKSKAISLVVSGGLDDQPEPPYQLIQNPSLNQTEDTLADSDITIADWMSVAQIIERRKECTAYVANNMGRPALAGTIEAGVNNAIDKMAKRANADADRATAKQQRAEAKKTEPEVKGFKLGRWEYPARMTGAGKVERNTKRDGSGTWVDADLVRGTLTH